MTHLTGLPYVNAMSSTTRSRGPSVSRAFPPRKLSTSIDRKWSIPINESSDSGFPFAESADDIFDERTSGKHGARVSLPERWPMLQEIEEQSSLSFDVLSCLGDATVDASMTESSDAEQLQRGVLQPTPSMAVNDLSFSSTYATALESTLGRVPIILHRRLSNTSSRYSSSSRIDPFLRSRIPPKPCSPLVLPSTVLPTHTTSFSSSSLPGGHNPPGTSTTQSPSLRSIRATMGALNAQRFATQAAQLLQNTKRLPPIPISPPIETISQTVVERLEVPDLRQPIRTSRGDLLMRKQQQLKLSSEGRSHSAMGFSSPRRNETRPITPFLPLTTIVKTAAEPASQSNSSGSNDTAEDNALCSSLEHPTDATIDSTLSITTAEMDKPRAHFTQLPLIDTSGASSPRNPQLRNVASCRSPLLLAHVRTLQQDSVLASPTTMSPRKEQTPPASATSLFSATTERPLRGSTSMVDLRTTALLHRGRIPDESGGDCCVCQSHTSMAMRANLSSAQASLKGKMSLDSINSAAFCVDSIPNLLALNFSKHHMRSYDEHWCSRQSLFDTPGYLTVDTRALFTDSPTILSPAAAADKQDSSDRTMSDFTSMDVALRDIPLSAFPTPPEKQQGSTLSQRSPNRFQSSTSIARPAIRRPLSQTLETTNEGDKINPMALSMRTNMTLPEWESSFPTSRQPLTSRFSTNTTISELSSSPSRTSSPPPHQQELSGDDLVSPTYGEPRQKRGPFALRWQPSLSFLLTNRALPPLPTTTPTTPMHNGVLPATLQHRSHGSTSTSVGSDTNFGESAKQLSIRPAKSTVGRTLFGLVRSPIMKGEESTVTEDNDSLGAQQQRRRSDFNAGASTPDANPDAPYVFCPTPPFSPGHYHDRRSGKRRGTLRNVMSKRILLPSSVARTP